MHYVPKLGTQIGSQGQPPESSEDVKPSRRGRKDGPMYKLLFKTDVPMDVVSIFVFRLK